MTVYGVNGGISLPFLSTALDGSGQLLARPALPSGRSSMCPYLGAVGTEPGPSSLYPILTLTKLPPLPPSSAYPEETTALSDFRFSQRWLWYGKETEILAFCPRLETRSSGKNQSPPFI
jgi:hypothetical protein